MSVSLIPKAALFSVAAFCSSFVDNISPHKHTDKEKIVIEERIEELLHEMRSSVDNAFGWGIFDGVASGQIDVIEFLECGDVEEFLKSYSISTPFCGTKTPSK